MLCLKLASFCSLVQLFRRLAQALLINTFLKVPAGVHEVHSSKRQTHVHLHQ